MKLPIFFHAGIYRIGGFTCRSPQMTRCRWKAAIPAIESRPRVCVLRHSMWSGLHWELPLIFNMSLEKFSRLQSVLEIFTHVLCDEHVQQLSFTFLLQSSWHSLPLGGHSFETNVRPALKFLIYAAGSLSTTQKFCLVCKGWVPWLGFS